MNKEIGEWTLFIGRYQPFHKGHEALIRYALNRGDNVCIGLREADGSKDNPLNFQERRCQIEHIFRKEIREGRLKIVYLPNISIVCYGRNVGWSIEEIRLDDDLESISASKIRDKCKSKQDIYEYSFNKCKRHK